MEQNSNIVTSEFDEDDVYNGQKSRHFCFTIFDKDCSDLSELRAKYEPLFKSFYENVKNNCEFIIGGCEVAPSTGRQHLQCYVQFPNPRHYKSIRKDMHLHFGVKHWIKPCKGSSLHNTRYCGKESDVFQYGSPSSIESLIEKLSKKGKTQGKRSDLVAIREQVNDGKNIRDIANSVLNLNDLRFAENYMKLFEQGRRPFVMSNNQKIETEFTVSWLYGQPGCGKTYAAHEIFAGKDYYVAMSSNKWWEGYDGQLYVIIDDFRGSFCPFNELLTLLQPYPLKIEVKGSSRQMKACHFIITSCQSPIEVYPKVEENRNQLYRRLTYIREYVEFNSYNEFDFRHFTPDKVDKKCRALVKFCEL